MRTKCSTYHSKYCTYNGACTLPYSNEALWGKRNRRKDCGAGDGEGARETTDNKREKEREKKRKKQERTPR